MLETLLILSFQDKCVYSLIGGKNEWDILKLFKKGKWIAIEATVCFVASESISSKEKPLSVSRDWFLVSQWMRCWGSLWLSQSLCSDSKVNEEAGGLITPVTDQLLTLSNKGIRGASWEVNLYFKSWSTKEKTYLKATCLWQEQVGVKSSSIW